MKQKLADFLVHTGALKFGEFTLKSGRKSPYFVNTGVLAKASEMRELCGMLAAKIEEVRGCEVIFGPAYKGIPLAVGTAMEMEAKGKDVYWVFNRKEAKGHGDKGAFVGHIPGNGESVVIIDDVFTTGGTKVEAVGMLRAMGAEVKAVVVAVDREEKGKEGSAVGEFTKETGVPVHSIATVSEMMAYLKGKGDVGGELYGKFLEYRREYGANTGEAGD